MNGDEQKKVKAKVELLLKEMDDLGLVLGKPERILPLFRRSKFRRHVVNMGLGQIHTWFVHKFVVGSGGAGVPRFRNLHVHNGSDQGVRSVTAVEEPPVDDDPVPAPPQGDVILPGEWAINDSFEPAGHMGDVSAIKVRLEKSTFPGLPIQRYEAVIDPQRPGEQIETAWLNILDDDGGGFCVESVLWMGADDNALQPVTPPIVPMQLLP